MTWSEDSLGCSVGADNVLYLIVVWVEESKCGSAEPDPLSTLGSESVHHRHHLSLQLQNCKREILRVKLRHLKKNKCCDFLVCPFTRYWVNFNTVLPFCFKYYYLLIPKYFFWIWNDSNLGSTLRLHCPCRFQSFPIGTN